MTGLDSLVFQERDEALLLGLFESRIMTSEHTAPLYFAGSREAAKKRLQKLKAAGLIGERTRRVNEPAILFLTRKGHNFLKERGSLETFPSLSASALERRARVSEQTLRHELDVMDVKAAFHMGADQSKKFLIAQFSTWPSLFQFKAKRPGRIGAEVPVKPDGFIRIHEHESDGSVSEHSPFFLEVDRSSEVLDRLTAQAFCYLDYYSSGEFAVWNGGTREQFKDHPFRVLVVFKSAERRNNLAERLLLNRPPILTQVLLSTHADATNDPFGNVWMRPLEYREATRGTPFDVDRLQSQLVYRRRTERDSFVESSVPKRNLLET